jgi:hypothetical protein
MGGSNSEWGSLLKPKRTGLRIAIQNRNNSDHPPFKQGTITSYDLLE